VLIVTIRAVLLKTRSTERRKPVGICLRNAEVKRPAQNRTRKKGQDRPEGAVKGEVAVRLPLLPHLPAQRGEVEMEAGAQSTGVAGSGNVRIGVFVCHCGGNISDVVDVKRVAEEIGKLPGVAYSTTYQFVCSDPGQALIEKTIKEEKLDRIVIAACSPSLHEATFRRTLIRAGLNPYLFEHVNIREQVSWVVEDPRKATEKAIRLVKAAVARSSHLSPLQKRKIPVEKSALVIGGGVAGLVAARELAESGARVTLVERSPFLGGRAAQLGLLFPIQERARDVVRRLAQAVLADRRIRVLTNTEVVSSEGFVGSFSIKLRRTPRGVTEELTDFAAAEAACPVEVPNEFDFGLTKRKAIWRPYPDCHPAAPSIDWDNCTRCGKCREAVGGKGIDLDGEPQEEEVTCGVIVLATGFDPYRVRQGEYGFAVHPEVVTLPQLVRMLDPTGPTRGELKVNGRPVKRIALIHCVGSRQYEGIHEPQSDGKVNDYCSRICCTALMRVACELKERFPEVRIYDFHEDIRTYGRGHEDYYTEASKKGTVFIRFDPFEPPVVEQDPAGEAPLVVRCKDRLTDGEELEVPVDLVVLGTGVMPRDISSLIDLFRCAVGPDRFLLEVHPKLRPVELAVSGVFLAGTVQGPMDMTEAAAAACAAASKASILMTKGAIELDPFVARVDEERCTGCQTCLYVCPYDAISRDEERKVAVVNEALCAGCGTCVAACPSNAIDQMGFSDRQIEAQVQALLSELGMPVRV